MGQSISINTRHGRISGYQAKPHIPPRGAIILVHEIFGVNHYIRAQADRTVIELTSDAARQAEITRGEADAERSGIYADAFGANPEFFDFYRSMTAYGKALQSGNTSMVLSPNSEFFNYLRSDLGTASQ